jgi:glycosyltransferase involved in cell wall biosynthesis
VSRTRHPSECPSRGAADAPARSGKLAAIRICLVYDCLFPHTVGGAERWYRNLGERLAAHGHEVTYLTLRQWDRGADPGVAGIDVIAVGPRMELYRRGRRRVLPPLVFGAGVLWHLLRRGRRYDVVHTASFPYFSLLAAGAVARAGRYELVVDWHEVWSRAYWREYLGRAGGAVGWLVQRACARIPQRAFSFSRLNAGRLRQEGLKGTVTVLEGEYAGSLEVGDPVPAEPVVVFAGRHIPEKRAPAVVPAIAAARQVIPDLRAEVYGDGPDRAQVLAEIASAGLGEAVTAPGFVSFDQVDAALRRALCMLAPSRREGYGLVVVEAAARGTPTVLVAEEDNAAVELVEDGVNGVLAASASPEDLGAAIVRVHEEGHALRESTVAWFRSNARRLSIDSSLDDVVAVYDEGSARR